MQLIIKSVHKTCLGTTTQRYDLRCQTGEKLAETYLPVTLYGVTVTDGNGNRQEILAEKEEIETMILRLTEVIKND